MKSPLSIQNGRVFVNGKETVDPVLIGYAVLDIAENSENIAENRKETIQDYIKRNKLRKTYERKILTDFVCKMDVFSSEILIQNGLKENISKSSTYNFINLLLDAKIISKQESFYFN